MGQTEIGYKLQKEKSGHKSSLISRNITVLGRRTSVRLEPEMWSSLKDIAKRENCKIHDICSLIQLRKNDNSSLTAAIRVFLMLYYRAATTEDGHQKAGHGNFNFMMRRARMTEDMLIALKKGGQDNVAELEKPVSIYEQASVQEDSAIRQSA